MNTIIIWDECGESPITFFSLEGDLSKFDKIYINSTNSDEALSAELSELLYDQDSGQIKEIQLDKFPTADITKETKIIVAGFIP
jgi:hypothetical protein